MAKPRTAKLKVFRTPIGFHDAYVAAPSQKAALAAWGSGTNLFAAGAAELVTDPKLTKGPLAKPGEVIRVVRGSEAEHVRALGKTAKRAGKRAADDDKQGPSPRPSPAGGRASAKRPPRPSHAPVDKAEQALERARQRHRDAVQKIRAEEERLAKRRRELEARHRDERDALQQALDEARERYSAAMEEWAE